MLDPKTSEKKRIVIIQYHWGVQSYTRDLIRYLADQGYFVTFFIDKELLRKGVINTDTLRTPNVEVIELSEICPPAALLWTRIKAKAKREVLARLNNPLWLIDRADLDKVTRWVTAHKAKIVSIIGIEKRGFIFSGVVGRKFGIPYIYYSLELYFADWSKHWLHQRQLDLERKYHQSAAATIVQDDLRGAALYAHNQIGAQPKIFIPVGVTSLPKMPSTYYWHRKFELPEGSKIFLYFGDLTMWLRGLDNLVDAWASCPQEYVLVLHGTGDTREINAFCKQRQLPHVFISTELAPEGQIRELVSSAEVGLCIYKNTDPNNRLTAFSSQKIALYLREAVPIISADNESYRKLYQKFKCGLSISSYEEVGAAARNILADYTSFKTEARRAFDSIYDNEISFPKLIRFLNNLERGRIGVTSVPVAATVSLHS